MAAASHTFDGCKTPAYYTSAQLRLRADVVVNYFSYIIKTMRIKIELYILGLTIHILANLMGYFGHNVIFHPASFITYLLLGAIPFLIKMETLNLIATQIILFSFSFIVGGTYNCSGGDCELEGLSALMPIIWIFWTVIGWGIAKIIQYSIKNEK